VSNGRLLAFLIACATVAFIVVGTLWPIQTATAMAGSESRLLRPSSSPQAAVQNLADDIGRKDWEKAYSSLANNSEFTETEFARDLTGSYASLRTNASLDSFDLRPLHASADEAQVQLKLRWSTVVGTFLDTRNLQVTKTGDRWGVVWPIVKEPRVPPQVIPVNYLRWDVIYRGAEDDWGAQDVEAPHVRIVDMHPVDRGGGVVIMGELLNEDVVPAFVTVKATLLAKNGSAIATEDSFDKISHILLPRQVTPFLIEFHNIALSQVDSVHMQPSSTLIAASADPVIEIEDQHLNPGPQPSLSGKLLNQSGQVVNVAHVLGTFYDNSGQLVWVSDQYVERALLPQTPVSFAISLPADIAGKVKTERAVTTTYSSNRFQ
jgi:NTF2-like N-terminal transpeptidase domain